jgi:hypothetical protein
MTGAKCGYADFARTAALRSLIDGQQTYLKTNSDCQKEKRMINKDSESQTPENGQAKGPAEGVGKGDARRSLTPEQIEFAAVLGDCLARQWLAKQSADSNSDDQERAKGTN